MNLVLKVILIDFAFSELLPNQFQNKVSFLAVLMTTYIYKSVENFDPISNSIYQLICLLSFTLSRLLLYFEYFKIFISN